MVKGLEKNCVPFQPLFSIMRRVQNPSRVKMNALRAPLTGSSLISIRPFRVLLSCAKVAEKTLFLWKNERVFVKLLDFRPLSS